MHPVTYAGTAHHLQPSVDVGERKVQVAQAFQVLNSSGVEFDMLAATGVSGIMFGTSLSDQFNVPLCVVRKQEVPQANSMRETEGPDKPGYEWPALRWIFVDDLISSGNTWNRVTRAIEKKYGDMAKCVGIFLYLKWDCSSYTLGEKNRYTTVNNIFDQQIPVFTLEGRMLH